jgi:multidrug transporter EmrE-like cation transporter
MSYFYIACTVLLTVYGQIIIKAQVMQAGPFPEAPADKLWFLARLLLNPWIISALMAALLAAVAWMAAMTKLPLSHAYPYTSLAFVLVLGLSALCFGEPLTMPKLAGVALIVIGIAVGSQG